MPELPLGTGHARGAVEPSSKVRWGLGCSVANGGPVGVRHAACGWDEAPPGSRIGVPRLTSPGGDGPPRPIEHFSNRRRASRKRHDRRGAQPSISVLRQKAEPSSARSQQPARKPSYARKSVAARSRPTDFATVVVCGSRGALAASNEHEAQWIKCLRSEDNSRLRRAMLHRLAKLEAQLPLLSPSVPR